eukprot:4582717-Prymnesium_polylepis.1
MNEELLMSDHEEIHHTSFSRKRQKTILNYAIAQRRSADLMSGVACATPVTPSLPSSRLGARLLVGEWLPRADGTLRQKILWYASAQDTSLADRHKKTGCHPRKNSIRDLRNIVPALRAGGTGKGLRRLGMYTTYQTYSTS